MKEPDGACCTIDAKPDVAALLLIPMAARLGPSAHWSRQQSLAIRNGPGALAHCASHNLHLNLAQAICDYVQGASHRPGPLYGGARLLSLPPAWFAPFKQAVGS